MNDHNYNTGFLNYCQICYSKDLLEVINLGYQPLADDLIKVSEFNRECIYYPIKIYLCKKCQYLQNNYIVGDKILYNKNYHYDYNLLDNPPPYYPDQSSSEGAITLKMKSYGVQPGL